MKQTVVILCPHRSGSSALAGLLHTMGVNMGNDLLGPSPDNPKGHFEDSDFVQFAAKFLVLRGGAWDQPPSVKAMCEMLPAEREQFKELISKKKSKLWGWKDPRTVLYISNVYDLIPDPFYIWVERDEKACNKSIQAREKRRGEKKIKTNLYAIHKFMLNMFLEKSGALVSQVDYYKLLAEPERYIEHFAKKWNLPITDEVKNFIDPTLCHWK